MAVTAAMISGPVVSSWASGLLTYRIVRRAQAIYSDSTRTLRYWSRMMPPGIWLCNFCATPAIVKEFSHERYSSMIWMLYLYVTLGSPKLLRLVYGRLLRQVHEGRLPSPIDHSVSKTDKSVTRRATYQRHLVRHRYDDGISLIYSIQHMSVQRKS